MSVLDKLKAIAAAPVSDARVYGAPKRSAPVAESDDLTRILNLPRRPIPSEEEMRAMAVAMTARLRRERAPGDPCSCARLRPEVVEAGQDPCLRVLRPIQAWYLTEAEQVRGAAGFINVGGGKCLAAGSEVFDVASGARFDVSEVPSTVEVSSLHPEGLGVAAATCFASGSKPCWRVLLADGSRVDASYDHKVLTTRGWIEAAQLAPGDLVAVPRWSPAPRIVTDATDAEVILLAYAMADGGCSGSMLRFTNASPPVIEEFKRVATGVCGGYSESASRSAAREFTVLQSRSFREKWGLTELAKAKRFAAKAWGLSDRHIALLLNRFWACDGYIEPVRGGFGTTLASEKLIDDIRFLLLRLGIRSRKRERSVTCAGDRFTAWRLTFAGADAARFVELVGPILGKETAFEAARAKLNSTRRNTNFDIVPVSVAEAHEIATELGWPAKADGGWKRDGARNRTKAFRELGVTAGQYISRPKFETFCVKYNYVGKYRRLLREGIAWEQVERTIPLGVLPVFDLSVPGTHNFVTNGMVVHNTCLDILSAMVVLQADQLAVLLISPTAVSQFMHDYKCWSQHFQTPNLVGGPGPFYPGRPRLEVFPYSKLQIPKNATWFTTRKPSLIIADEAQALKSRDAVRVGRFLRYFAANPETRFTCHSGSLTTRGVEDFAHLLALSHRENSPMPLDVNTVNEWGETLNPGPAYFTAKPGPLIKLVSGSENIRQALHRRIVETRGVVATTDASIEAKLVLREASTDPVPQVILDALAEAHAEKRPDGQDLMDAMEVAQVCSQIACGFYYRWRFPNGEPDDLIHEWFERRKEWAAELREQVKYAREDGLDSPGLFRDAAERARIGYKGPLPVWKAKHWAAWKDIEPRVRPVPGDPVWLDDFLVRAAAKWATEGAPGIVWYGYREFGYALHRMTKLTRYGEGAKASAMITQDPGKQSIIASIKAHHKEKNLQYRFWRCLVANLPADGGIWDQMIGRIHRPGQPRETVEAYYFAHVQEVRDTLEKAQEFARYIQPMTGNPQKLLYGKYEGRGTPPCSS